MASRGSVIPLFHEQILAGQNITVTDPEMTRFMMTLDDAVELVLYAFENGNSGDIFVQKSPAATIGQLADVLLRIYQSKMKVKVIGTRHSEKLYETLLSKEEMKVAEDLGNYFRVASDNRDLNYDKYFSVGDGSIATVEEYHSHNTTRLSDDELITLLGSIGYK
jgi:UDP-glucose 4-epimerase